METEKDTHTPPTGETAVTPATPETAASHTPTPAAPTVDTAQKASFLTEHKSMIVSLGIAVVVLAGAGYYYFSSQKDDGAVVAVVGNQKIYEKEYTESVNLIEQNAIAQGANLTDAAIAAEIKKQAIDNLVNNALLLSAASEAGITSSDAEVQAKYDELTTELGGADVLTEEMAKVGLTEEKLKSNIRERVVADKYIESVTDIELATVSDEEVADFVKTITEAGQELPPLEEIRTQIEAQLIAQKQQQIISDLLATLRSETTVDIKI